MLLPLSLNDPFPGVRRTRAVAFLRRPTVCAVPPAARGGLDAAGVSLLANASEASAERIGSVSVLVTVGSRPYLLATFGSRVITWGAGCCAACGWSGPA